MKKYHNKSGPDLKFARCVTAVLIGGRIVASHWSSRLRLENQCGHFLNSSINLQKIVHPCELRTVTFSKISWRERAQPDPVIDLHLW